ncbi:type II secretion system protein [Candidatus Saccharibacteria bacterium]|nr:type II secretion system protein [Candidatus Saccharibacteria bacterium]
MVKNHKLRKGDTLIEVMFAVAVFGLAAVGTIALMNRGLASTQNSLETTMARQEIDAQAEALRFLHGAYISEPKKADATPLDQVCSNPASYRDLWKCLTTKHVYDSESSTALNKTIVTDEDTDFYTHTTSPGQYCDDIFRTNSSTSFSVPSKSFILNPRSLDISDLDTVDDITKTLKKTIVTNDIQTTRLNLAGTYPRLLYGDATSTSDDDNLSDATIGSGNLINYGDNKKTLEHSEGIWITSVASPSGVQCKVGESGDVEFRPDYYDFHIQTCWDSAANNSASTIESTVRLFNPDQIALVNKSSQLKLEDMALFFVMTWTGGNSDIDAHLEGSKDRADGGSSFHVYYGAKEAGEKKSYSFVTSGEQVSTFQLDVDAISAMNYCSSQDRWCGNGNGNGNVEVIAFRSLFPATFKYYVHDYAGQGLSSQGLKVRVFVGQADSGVGQWPHDAEPVATFDYPGDTGRTWNVAEFEVKADGTFVIGGQTLSLAQALPEVSTITSDGACTRVGSIGSENKSIDLPDDQRDGSQDQTPDPTPESTPEVEETIIATESNPLQNLSIKFTKSDYDPLGIKRSGSTMSIPAVSRIGSGVGVNQSTCSVYSNRQGLFCTFPHAYSLADGYSYMDGEFVLYLDKNSFTNDSSVSYFGTGPAIDDFWNYRDLKVDVYFYNRIMYNNEVQGHEDSVARYKISSDSVRTVDANGRYWILARVYGNPSSNYWIDRIEIINQRTNRDPSSYL